MKSPLSAQTDTNSNVVLSNHGLRNSGGIERYLLTLVRGLHQRGIRPTVVAKKFDRKLPEYGWVHPVHLWVGWAPRKWRDFAFDWQLRRRKKKGLLPGPVIACNQTHAADIAICGSTHPGFLHASEQTPSWLDHRKISLERGHLENAQVVVAHSMLMKQQVMKFYGLPEKKIQVLYPPIDMGVFSTINDNDRQVLRQQLALPDDKPIFLLASTGHKRKGLDLLLSIFNHDDAPGYLVVAGRPIPITAKHIRYLGYRADIQNIYRAVDFTIMASSFEPFGLVGVESILCGTQVLLARGVGCAEVISPPAAILFDLPGSCEPHIENTLQQAIELATQRWQTGQHRLSQPVHQLRYQPSVSTHLDALLSLVQACQK